jgi:hypothetical protein
MAAHMKLRGSREQRLLALVGLGESMSAACRAVNVAPVTVRRHAQADPAFALLLSEAREQGRSGSFDPGAPMDWHRAARALERSDPLRWALPGVADPFNFDSPPE